MRGLSPVAVSGPLTVAASPVAEHRLQTRRLSSCGSRVQLLRGMWDPPRPGLKPVSPHTGRQTLNHCASREALFFFFNWSVVTLQCCAGFYCTTKCISYTYTYIPSVFGFPSHLGHHRALNRVPDAIQEVLICYLFYT